MSSTLFTPPLPRFLHQNLQEETCIVNKCPGLENTDLVWHLKSLLQSFLSWCSGLISSCLPFCVHMHQQVKLFTTQNLRGWSRVLGHLTGRGEGHQILVFLPATQAPGTSAQGKLGFCFTEESSTCVFPRECPFQGVFLFLIKNFVLQFWVAVILTDQYVIFELSFTCFVFPSPFQDFANFSSFLNLVSFLYFLKNSFVTFLFLSLIFYPINISFFFILPFYPLSLVLIAHLIYNSKPFFVLNFLL